MTTPAAPVLAVPVCSCPHGEVRRHAKRQCHGPCRCVPCRAAVARQAATRRRNARAGKPHHVPAAPSAAILNGWRDQNIGLTQLAKATSLRRNDLLLIANGTRKRVCAVTAEIIAAARPLPALFDTCGSRRRLQALFFAGHTLESLAVECRTSRRHLGRIMGADHQLITCEMRDSVAAVYERLASIDGGYARNKTEAIARGYLPWIAWDSDNIDVADAKPYEAGERLSSREDVDWVKVWRICSEIRRYSADGETTIGERDAVVGHLHRRGLNDVQIAEVTGWPDRTVLRIRFHRLNLPAHSSFTLGAAYRVRAATPSEHIAMLRRRWRTVLHSKHSSRLAKADARTALADLDVAAAALAELAQEAA